MGGWDAGVGFLAWSVRGPVFGRDRVGGSKAAWTNVAHGANLPAGLCLFLEGAACRRLWVSVFAESRGPFSGGLYAWFRPCQILPKTMIKLEFALTKTTENPLELVRLTHDISTGSRDK